jgi:Coenzyme PQQ synthesis protein D (PqqD)
VRSRAYLRSPDVIATDLGDELILLDPRNGEMFSLNPCGRRIWFALPAHSVVQVANALCSDYEVSIERARSDAERLLDALTRAGLVVYDDERT